MHSINGEALNIDYKIIDNYMNSDESGKQLKIAKMFGLVHFLICQLEEHKKEIERLNTALILRGVDTDERAK